jgi:hypothetical protein
MEQNEKCITTIGKHREKPELLNITLSNYTNKNKINDAWNGTDTSLRTDLAEIKKIEGRCITTQTRA